MSKIQIKEGYVDLDKISFISSVKKVPNITDYYFALIIDGQYHESFYKDKESAQEDFAKIFTKWM